MISQLLYMIVLLVAAQICVSDTQNVDLAKAFACIGRHETLPQDTSFEASLSLICYLFYIPDTC